MEIQKDTVVHMHYQLKEETGLSLNGTQGHDPLTVLIGHGQLIPGVESALLGRKAGDQFQVVISPQEGYGERQDNLIQRVPKKYFAEAKKLKPGMSTLLETKQGQRLVTVIKVGESVVDIDLNHPLAGQTLHFDLEIVDVREATEEEIAHGHAHGPGGHQHD